MNIILGTLYGLLLITALVFAGTIVYHMITYNREDFNIEYTRSAQKNLVIYLVSSLAVLVGSIAGAIILYFMFN